MLKKIFIISFFVLLFHNVSFLQAEDLEQIVDSVKKEELFNRLKVEVDQLLQKKDFVNVRREIDKVFTFIDLLNEREDSPDLFKYLNFALKHNPWNLKYQILLAQYLLKQNKKEEAVSKIEIVLNNAEDDNLIERAKRIIKDSSAYQELESMIKVDGSDHILVLVPVGDFDFCVLSDLKEKLSEFLGIEVRIQKASINVPEYTRDAKSKWVEQLRERLHKEINSKDVILAMNELNFSALDFVEDRNVILTVSRIIENTQWKPAKIKFEKNVEKLKGLNAQWEIEDLTDLLEEYVTPFKRNKCYYLGVTKLDCFYHKSNFIFGLSFDNKGIGIISYARFTAAFNGTIPNRKKLVGRTFKQALSSLGFMVGVRRCSNSTCARAYPHSLEEHDAKSEKLCSECKTGFDKVFVR